MGSSSRVWAVCALGVLSWAALLGCLSATDGSVSRPVFVPSKIKAPFVEQFLDDALQRWHPSEATKVIFKEKTADLEEATENDEKSSGEPIREEYKYDGLVAIETASLFPGLESNKALTLKSRAKHHAIAALFPKTIDPKDKKLVVQYSVKFQEGLECGGAYLKLITKQATPFDPSLFDDKTPYTIMFGPDKCGTSTNKIHFIFRHKNPVTGVYEEKHLRAPPPATISRLSTLYTLVVRPDNSFEILVNQESVLSGNLLKDMDPPVNPAEEIDDPNDKKPVDWVDKVKIPDPNAKKPADWDEDAPRTIPDEEAVMPEGWLLNEPSMIDDPAAEKPVDWDDENDGDWPHPKVANPKCADAPGCGPWKRPSKPNPDYKGKWSAPMIDNPDYRGPWICRKIPNPAFFDDQHPHNFEPMVAIGFEIWTLQKDIQFDDIFIGHSEEDAKAFAQDTWAPHYAIEKSQEDEEEEKAKKAAEEGKDALGASSWVDSAMEKVVEVVADLQDDPVYGLQKHGVILAGIAFVLFFLSFVSGRFLFKSNKTKTSAASDAAKRKKLDLVEPDTTDAPATALKEKENKVNSSSASATPTSPKSRGTK